MSDKTSLGFKQATTEPCKGCEAPCCTRVPLYDFNPTRLVEIDYALYLCNFDRVEIALTDGPSMRVYYRMRCGNLTEKDLCAVHGTAEQPAVCKRYNPYTCMYKRLFIQGDSDGIRMDRRRMEIFAEQVQFDKNHNIVAVPSVEQLRPHLPPMEPIDDPPAYDDEVYSQRQAVFRGEMAIDKSLYPLTKFQDNCAGCRAWCCTTLSFPHATPATASSLDYLGFLLNFPGIEVGVSPNQWTVSIRTTCRHLVRDAEGSGRCGVFGQPERPQTCQIYDEQTCGFKAQFKHHRPAHYLRLRRADFDLITRALQFDEDGALQHLPNMEEMRATIEASW